MRMARYIHFLLCALALAGCRAKVADSAEVVPELRLATVRFRVYRGDALRAFGVSEGASLRRDSSEVKAEQLQATLPREGEPIHLFAPKGEGSLLSRVFTVSGGVLAWRGDDVARTATARYEPLDSAGVVRGDDPVVLEGAGYRLEGAGFTLHPEPGTIVVHGGARLVAGLPEGR